MVGNKQKVNVRTATYSFGTGTKRSPIVYLPVEFMAREFDSKALLAATLASRGYMVVIGQQWMVYENLHRLPAGVMLFKSFNNIHHPPMLRAKKAGHFIAILEEELLAHIEEKAIRNFCTDHIFELPNLVIANGAFEQEVLKRLSGGKARVEVAGNGRIDLLKTGYRGYFQKEIDAIKARHGDFILVNTNFGIINTSWESLEEVTRIHVDAGFVKPEDPASMQAWQDQIEFEELNKAAILEAVRELARRRPGQKIVVRPHPAEDLKRWEDAFPGLPNVEIVREGPHVPWTLACRMLLHTSCTTGFEARVAGKTAFSLVPKPNWISDSFISNQVNPVFRNAPDLVAAVEKFLDAGEAPALPPEAIPPAHYVWNFDDENGIRRIADLLVKELPPPKPVVLPALEYQGRDERLKSKFFLLEQDFRAVLERVRAAAGITGQLAVREIGESLFCIGPAAAMQPAAPPKKQLDPQQVRGAIESAFRSGRFQATYDAFRENFGEAHRHPDLCFLAGVSLFELGRFPLALQYFQNASVIDNVRNDIAFMMALTHQRLGQHDLAHRYASIAYSQVPVAPEYFDLVKESARACGKPVPEHWIVIGCSHVRYFRYLQANQAKFFGDAVHLECHEYGGATAFGLGNATSQSGALKGTQQVRPRLAKADRVLIYFGEIDCRRAAWKAAAVSGRPIEETIDESVQHLEAYVSREILPHTRKVVLLGAKPQIIRDEDFYRNAQVDERIVFKPLPERERITLRFNAGVRAVSEKLGLAYADIDHVLADEASREAFFRNAFWDNYTDDTHGNVDYFASLYHERLKGLVGQR